jgi:hypothetical protein
MRPGAPRIALAALLAAAGAVVALLLVLDVAG